MKMVEMAAPYGSATVGALEVISRCLGAGR